MKIIIKKIKKKKNIINNNDEINEELLNINGYELIIYKNIYYYRDLETNEIYNIIDNKIGIIVGIMTNKNKIKLSK
jgi:ribosomal 30S subunit maturation factor RimM